MAIYLFSVKLNAIYVQLDEDDDEDRVVITVKIRPECFD